MSIDRDIGKRLRQFRKKHIGSQVQAAGELESSQKHISNMENGKASVGIDIIRMLIKKYHLNANWMLTGTGNWVTNLKDNRKLIHDLSDINGDIQAMNVIIKYQEKRIKQLENQK